MVEAGLEPRGPDPKTHVPPCYTLPRAAGTERRKAQAITAEGHQESGWSGEASSKGERAEPNLQGRPSFKKLKVALGDKDVGQVGRREEKMSPRRREHRAGLGPLEENRLLG